MYHSIHSEFIETPLIEILKEGVHACRPLGVGMHTEPMKEYFLSSLFLRMTGAQEQKLKCICWELATHDYEFRYKYTSKMPLGEMSSLDDKKKLYKALWESISKIMEPSMGNITLKKDKIAELRDQFFSTLEEAPVVATWLKQDLDLVRGDASFLLHGSNELTLSANTLKDTLEYDYESVVYRHRNRCAHNLTSYQRCFYSFDRLKDKDYPRQNYVYRFVILILIDEIFIELYQKYKELVERSPWY
nr:hypothetical protein [uncultured Porphyromonas sp.]